MVRSRHYKGDLDGQTNSDGINFFDVSGDAYLSKYRSDGSREWTRLLGSSSGEGASSVSTSSDGSIYIVGNTSGNLDGQLNSDKKGITFAGDAFISKYNSDGSKDWTRLLGTSSLDSASEVSVADDGSIYITGILGGDLEGETNNDGGAFLSKYNSDGSNAWTQLLDSSSHDYGRSVAAADDGSVFIVGKHGNLDGQINSGDSDIFIAKYSGDGSKEWSRLLGSSGIDSATQ